MNAYCLPARCGWGWLVSAFALYRRNPAFLSLVCFAYWALVIFINLIPILGAVIASIIMPALSVGVMSVCRDLDRGQSPVPATLFSGFGDHRNTLFLLGGLYLLLSLGLIYFSSLLDGGQMLGFLLTARLPGAAPDQFIARWTPLIILALFLPVFMAYWYAPMLAAWHRLSVAKSLFFSLIACGRNWRAFLVYWLTLFCLLLLAPATLLALTTLLAPTARSLVSLLLLLPLLTIAMPVVFASFYLSYRDVFSSGKAD